MLVSVHACGDQGQHRLSSFITLHLSLKERVCVCVCVCVGQCCQDEDVYLNVVSTGELIQKTARHGSACL